MAPSQGEQHQPNQRRVEVSGSLTLQPVAPERGSIVGDDRPIQIDLSTDEEDIVMIDFSRMPPVKGSGLLMKMLWRSRSGLAEWFTAVGQPVRVRVAGETWLSIDIAPSRLGRWLKMPGLTLGFSSVKILKERFRQG